MRGRLSGLAQLIRGVLDGAPEGVSDVLPCLLDMVDDRAWLEPLGLRDLIITGRATPSFIVSHELGLDQAADGYSRFDKREDGWTKVLLHPSRTA